MTNIGLSENPKILRTTGYIVAHSEHKELLSELENWCKIEEVGKCEADKIVGTTTGWGRRG